MRITALAGGVGGARFLRGLRGIGRAADQRKVMERDVVARGELVELLVVRHDRRDLDRQQ